MTILLLEKFTYILHNLQNVTCKTGHDVVALLMQKKNMPHFALSLHPSEGHSFCLFFYRPYYPIEYQYYKEKRYVT